MNRFPGLEATILKTLEEQEEMRPPQGRLAQEWFWRAASRLRAQGRCVADQQAGVVRRAESESLPAPDPTFYRADGLSKGRACERCGAAWADHAHPGSQCPPAKAADRAPATDLHARLRLLLRRWRAGGAEQCALALEEVMEECGVEP